MKNGIDKGGAMSGFQANSGPSSSVTKGRISATSRLMHCDKRSLFRSLRRHGRAMAAMTRLATVDQLLRKVPAVLDASDAPDGFNNLGGLISWIKSLSASVSNGLRSILKFEGAVFAASL